jgi:hypothetical protein
MGQVYQCWWRICREINILSRFEYHMFYVLYPFVTYLLLLPCTHLPLLLRTVKRYNCITSASPIAIRRILNLEYRQNYKHWPRWFNDISTSQQCYICPLEFTNFSAPKNLLPKFIYQITISSNEQMNQIEKG